MLIHEDYGKRVLTRATNREVQFTGPSVHVDYGTKHPARIDATVGDIAVEMESRTAKQIRGAVVDLLLHPYRKKLLMIVPVHMQDQHVAAEQCRSIFQRLKAPRDGFEVVVLEGTGKDPKLDGDARRVGEALKKLAQSDA